MNCEDKDCDKHHVQHNGKCVPKNSPAGRIILRGGSKPAIVKEATFPAYADKELREKVSVLAETDKDLRDTVDSITQKVNEVGHSIQDIEELRQATKSITQRVDALGSSLNHLNSNLGSSLSTVEESVNTVVSEVKRIQHEDLKSTAAQVQELSRQLDEYRKSSELIKEETQKALDEARQYSDKTEASLAEMRAIARAAEKNLSTIDVAVKKVNDVVTAVEANNYVAKIKEASEEGANKVSQVAEKANEYIKQVVETGEKVVSDYFGKFKHSVDEVSKEAENVSKKVDGVQTLVDDTVNDALVKLEKKELESENKISEEAVRVRSKTGNDLLLQASAVQATLAASSDARMSRPREYEPHPVFEREPERPKYVKEEVKTSQQFLEGVEKLKLEEIQAAADSNAARDLRSKLETSYNLYNQQVAHYKTIEDQIVRLESKQNRTDEDQLNLARASDAADRSSASIDELRSQIKSLEQQYSRISSLAASEMELLKKHSAEIHSKQVLSDVSREKAIQEKAKVYSSEAAQASLFERRVEPSEVKAKAMKVLMKAGIKFGTPEYNSLMGPLRQAISRGEEFDLEELKIAAQNMQN
jgi:chromosome segregation ATPase